MTATVWVPRDAGALALGAEATARALLASAGAGIRIRRNGSRGLYWLEPLVEVECAAGRIAYGPLTASDVPALLRAGLLEGGAHPLRIGPIGQHPWLASQQRLTFARVGDFDPLDLDAYEAEDIKYEDALRNADSVNDLRLQIKLNSKRSKSQDLSAGTAHFSIV